MNKLIRDHIKTNEIKNDRFDLQVTCLSAAFMLTICAILFLNVKDGVEGHLMSGACMVISILFLGYSKERSQKIIKV